MDEQQPFTIDVKIQDLDHDNVFIGECVDTDEQFIIEPSEGELPFTIISVPEPKPLTEEERMEKFLDAISHWINRHPY